MTLSVGKAHAFDHEIGGRIFLDPDSAIRAAEAGPDDRRLAAYLKIAEAWGPEYVADAACWAAALSDPAERSDVFVRLGEVILPVSPETAFSLSNYILPGAAHDRFFRSIVNQWAKDDLSAATAGLPPVADSRLHAELQSAIAFAWAQHDAQGAATRAGPDRRPARLCLGVSTGLEIGLTRQTDTSPAPQPARFRVLHAGLRNHPAASPCPTRRRGASESPRAHRQIRRHPELLVPISIAPNSDTLTQGTQNTQSYDFLNFELFHPLALKCIMIGYLV